MRKRTLPPNQKSVWMALGDHANDGDGTGAYPSQMTLARETGYSESQVRRILRELEKRGAIAEEKKPGRRTTRGYRIMLDAVPLDPRALRAEESAALAVRPDEMTGLDSIKTGHLARQDRSSCAVRPVNMTAKPSLTLSEPLFSKENNAPLRARRFPDHRVKALIGTFCRKYEAKVRKVYVPVWGKDGDVLKRLLIAGQTPEAIEIVMDRYFADPFHASTGYDIGRFGKNFNALNSAGMKPDTNSTRVIAPAGKYDRFK